MKKLMIFAVAVVAFTVAACSGNKTESCGTCDSDTIIVDSIHSDSCYCGICTGNPEGNPEDSVEYCPD